MSNPTVRMELLEMDLFAGVGPTAVIRLRIVIIILIIMIIQHDNLIIIIIIIMITRMIKHVIEVTYPGQHKSN